MYYNCKACGEIRDSLNLTETTECCEASLNLALGNISWQWKDPHFIIVGKDNNPSHQ
jgi:hypothetical protein